MSNSIDVSGNEAAEERPVFKHDCERCVFLGHRPALRDGEVWFFDLYFHPADTLDTVAITETVIARFGSGAAYFSGLHFAAPYIDIDGEQQPGIAPLVIARQMAVKRGLLASLPA